MYIIDDKIKINLKHVERTETNDRDNSIIFEMVSGKCAIKKFNSKESAAAELSIIEGQIDLA